MTERIFIVRRRNKPNLILKESEIIENALEQEKEGIEPSYARYFNNEVLSPPGWLVWSTWESGCGVCYRRDDGKMIVTTGWQGDFCCLL